MAVQHNMGAGDRLPIIQMVAKEADGSIVDLTGCTAVLTYKRKDGTGSLTTKTATISSPTGGVMEYAWADGDTTNMEDFYNAQWITTNASGKQRTFPALGFDTIHIQPRLA